METREELLKVAARNKFDKYLPLESRMESVGLIISNSHLNLEVNTFEIFCKDVKDIKFLNLALTSEVNCIVSGDIHLLELHPFQGIPILNPFDFLAWVNDKSV